jgi:hypothetical protein
VDITVKLEVTVVLLVMLDPVPLPVVLGEVEVTVEQELRLTLHHRQRLMVVIEHLLEAVVVPVVPAVEAVDLGEQGCLEILGIPDQLERQGQQGQGLLLEVLQHQECHIPYQ